MTRASRLLPAVRLGAVLALLLLALPAAADPSPSPTLEPEAPLRVLVTQLLPRAPQAHDPVVVRGYVQNVGSSPVARVQVRLAVGEVVTTRGGLHDADTDRPPTHRTSVAADPAATALAPGQRTSFTLSTDVDALGLSRLGVYPLDVEARGDVGDGRELLGVAPTWLPYFAGVRPRQNRVAVLWPLVDRPRQAPDGAFVDDELATGLSARGRLGRVLTTARAAQTPVCDSPLRRPDGTPAATPRCDPMQLTLAVDPDLVSAADAMSKGYRVHPVRGEKRDGAGQSTARTWLEGLRAATRTGALLALPFADPDVSALSRLGQSGSNDVLLAGDLGRRVVGDVLQAQPLDNVAWPPAGPLTARAADTLATARVKAFVLDQSAYPQPDSEPARTPDTHTVLRTSATGATLEGLVVDPYLSDLVTGRLSSDLGPRLAEQRFVAETAILAAEAPGRSRTLVLAPDREDDVVPAAASEALRDLGRLPWLCSVSLESVADRTESCAGGTPESPVAEPTDRGTPRDSADLELSAGYLRGVARDRDLVAQLTGSVLDDDPAVAGSVAAVKTRLRQAVARAESSAWRGHPTAAATSARLLREEVDHLESQVVLRGGRALLTSSKGVLQVSVENSLPLPIKVRVRFSSKTATLSAAETGLVSVGAKRAVSASVKAQAQRSGRFVVFAQMVDRSGRPFGQETEVAVRSTRYGRLALAVTIAGAGVLFLAAGVRILRRARRPSA